MSTSTETPLLFPGVSPELSEDEIKVELSKIKNLTSPVSNWEVKFELDHANSPAIFIYGTIEDDETQDEKARFRRRAKIRATICQLIADKINSDIFTYVYFRVPSDISPM